MTLNQFSVNNHLVFKNTKISYTDTGSGNVVVLLHGFLENKTMWKNIVPKLALKNRVVTIDLYGHGDSECSGYVHVMEDQADMVYGVISHLKIRKITLIGHSMGGYVALAFAESYGGSLSGLVLLNSTARADSEERKMNRDRAVLAVKHNYATFVSMSIANLFSEENRAKMAAKIEKVKIQALQTPLQGIVASLEGMKIRQDRQIILSLTTFPIVLGLGKKDGVLNYDENKTQVNGTQAKLVTFSHGHMSHIENELKVITVLQEFLIGIKN